MKEQLEGPELAALVESVFSPVPGRGGLCILVDVPGGGLADDEAWRLRRHMARRWAELLAPELGRLGLDPPCLRFYPNVGTANAELPATVYEWDGELDDLEGEGLVARGRPLSLESVLRSAAIVLAPTQLSATAPLKLLGKRFAFRGATMPRFHPSMIPALALDFDAVDERVRLFRDRLQAADGVRLVTSVNGADHELHLDLRHRRAVASSGLMRQDGAVGNLPSGEAYCVPYEGELQAEGSRSQGTLPIEKDGQVLLLSITDNRIVAVHGSGSFAERFRTELREEPARANVAELGIGVLDHFGVEAVGITLLDEKLGLHVAFGRSDHLGGTVSPGDFAEARRVSHVDWVYLPSLQPSITVREAVFLGPGGEEEVFMSEGRFLL